jgi:hypothetical protein
MIAIDLHLRAEWVENVGYRYDVLLHGEVIVHRSRDPEYDAARVLHARGLRGWFRTIDFRTGRARMTFDIERCAKLRTVERDLGGLTVEPYLPMSDGDRIRLRPPSPHQPGVSLAEVGFGTLERNKRAGGETAEAPRRVPEEA